MIRRVRVWLRALLTRGAVEREMNEEMQEHLERAVERLVARGLSPAAARLEARREFGNVAYLQEEARDARGVRLIEETLQDVRYALRSLRLRPGFALAIIATLGLGIGANATMFGIVDRVLFRPPAFLAAPERSHRLYFARMVDGAEQLGTVSQYRRFLDFAESTRAMDVIVAYAPRRLPVGSGETVRETHFGFASASIWQLFSARPALGRFFSPEEDRDPGGARVAVISYAYWQRQYAGATSVIGETIFVAPNRYTIIGVTPSGFGGLEVETPEVLLPLSVAAADDIGPTWPTDRGEYALNWLELYGRRRADVSLEAAEADLSAAYRDSYRKQLSQQPTFTPIEVAKPRVVLRSMLAQRGPNPSAESRVSAWLLGVTGIVLLIACANVGNLLLARALSRRREIAVRVALGVSRARLTRHLLIESTILAVLGAVAGVALAQWGGTALRAFLLPAVEWQSAMADRRVVLFASMSALLAGVLAGIGPVVHATRANVIAALKTGARDGGTGRSKTRTALMLAQAALSVVLLVGAGLFVRSVTRVSRVHLGYDADRLLTVQFRLRNTALDSAGEAALRRALMERAMSNPAVENVSIAWSVPFAGTRSGYVFVDGRDSSRRLPNLLVQAGSSSYFETTGTRILRGRGFSADDRLTSRLVVVVSEGMARALWPGEDALGKCLHVKAAAAPCRAVVGIAENVKQASLGDDPGFMFYLPAAQAGENGGRFLVRTRDDATRHAESLRRDLQSAMPASEFLVVRPMARTMSNITRSWRLGATMFAVFGVLALVIAAIGLYSVVAYAVAQRTHEVGVRIALGARVSNVVALVVRDALRVVVGGLLLGVVLAVAGGRWLEPLLFQVSPRDPLVFAAVTAVLVLVGVIASSVPALRASRVDPVTALRMD